MGELFVEEGTLPGDDPHHLTRRRRHDLASRAAAGRRRSCGCAAASPSSTPRTISSRPPFCSSTRICRTSIRSMQIDDDHWEVTFDKIYSPGHEIGFSPDGRFLCMMNNLRENNCSVFNSSDPDPAQMEKDRACRGSAVARQVPEPVPHGVLDGQLEALSVDPASVAGRSGIMVVDTNTWTIIKEIQGIGPDLQTPGAHLRRQIRARRRSAASSASKRHRRHRRRDRRAGRHLAEQWRPPRLRHHPDRAGAHEAHPLVHALTGESDPHPSSLLPSPPPQAGKVQGGGTVPLSRGAEEGLLWRCQTR